jgi:hypothetical protein
MILGLIDRRGHQAKNPHVALQKNLILGLPAYGPHSVYRLLWSWKVTIMYLLSATAGLVGLVTLSATLRIKHGERRQGRHGLSSTRGLQVHL